AIVRRSDAAQRRCEARLPSRDAHSWPAPPGLPPRQACLSFQLTSSPFVDLKNARLRPCARILLAAQPRAMVSVADGDFACTDQGDDDRVGAMNIKIVPQSKRRSRTSGLQTMFGRPTITGAAIALPSEILAFMRLAGELSRPRTGVAGG